MNKVLGLLAINCKGLLDINVAVVLQANSGNVEVTLWRSRNMNNVRPNLVHKFSQIGKVPFDRKSFAELLGHERLAVADPHDLTIPNPQYLRRVRISDFSAANDSYLKHAARPARNF
jgi:hypothetical protein